MKKSKLEIQFKREGDESWLPISGREAWALLQLVAAENNGVTVINNPAPRWSAYIFTLRKLGVLIETVHERHGGPFPGTHGRYVLRSNITLRDIADGKA